MNNGAMPAHATIRFHGDLAALATNTDQHGAATVVLAHPRSVKDAIESCGVPHTEVDVVAVEGGSVDFTHRLSDGAAVDVYGRGVGTGLRSRVGPQPLPARFTLDVHLGRLAGRLRLLGFDAAYRNDVDDAALAAQSVRERRWLLTRDRGLLMRAMVSHGYLLRSTDPAQQVHEVIRRFDLSAQVEPLTRCARCNGPLAPVAKHDIDHRLEPGTRREQDTFKRCQDCGQLYWRGSHAAAIDTFVSDVTGAGAAARSSPGAGRDAGRTPC